MTSSIMECEEHNKKFNDNNHLKNLLIQYKYENKECSKLIFTEILNELSSIFELSFFESTIKIINKENSMEILINVPLVVSRIILIRLMLNDLMSISASYVNDDYDLGIILCFNI